MRKYITGVFFLVLSSHLFSQGVLSIMGKDYVADTLSYRQIAPGVLYSHIYMPDFPLNAFIMKVDLNNPYISVETFQAGDKVGKTERLTDGYTRLSYPGHQCVGGVNGNFWIVPVQGYPAPLLGMPHSGSMRKGEIVSDPNGWNRGWVNDPEGLLEEIGFAVIDKARKLWVDDMIFDGKVSIGPDNEYSVDNVNRLRTQDKLVVFNSYVGFTSRPSELPGTEVVVRPVSGAEWATSQNIDCEVVRIKNGYGGEPFSQGEYVLSGAGKAAEFLGQLSIGEQVCIHMGLCTRKDKLPLSASEMLTGNALVMKNGRLTIRNYNESYNSQNYPRTGIGCSADGKTLLMIVIDRRIGAGASTETMCEILRNAGATSVASLDGGGSAQMMIEKEIVNYPGDGNERAVANGWMLFNSAPVDNQIASISFDDYSLLLPRNAAYKPVILGYNKYGVLIDKNFQSFLLTCDTGIGEIKDHQTFIANGADGNGVLTASYQGYKISKKVQLVDSKICFAQDTMVVDNRFLYPISVQSVTSSASYPVDPASLDYTLQNPDVCKIENGQITGITNGITRLIGKLGPEKDTVIIKVQIPEKAELNMAVAPLGWSISGSSNLKNPKVAQASDGLSFCFDYSSGRSSSVKWTLKDALYGLPDSIRFVFKNGKVAFSKLVVAFKKRNSANDMIMTYEYPEIQQEYRINIPVDTFISEKEGLLPYPLSLSYMTAYLNQAQMESARNYKILMKEFSLVYKNLVVGMNSLSEINKMLIYPNPAIQQKIYIELPDDLQVTGLQASLFTLDGRLLQSSTVFRNNLLAFEYDLKGIYAGTYLLKVRTNEKSYSVKIVVR